MSYKLDEIKKWGKGKDFRIFVAGNYRNSRALGLLDKIAFWIKNFQRNLFFPVMMKDFVVPDPNNEEIWFKRFKKKNLPKIIYYKKELEVLSLEEQNEVAATIYLLQNCGYIFSELTTFGGGGPLAESLIAYRMGLKRYVFTKKGIQLNPMLQYIIGSSYVYSYKNENHLKELIESLLNTILTERNQRSPIRKISA